MLSSDAKNGSRSADESSYECHDARPDRSEHAANVTYEWHERRPSEAKGHAESAAKWVSRVSDRTQPPELMRSTAFLAPRLITVISMNPQMIATMQRTAMMQQQQNMRRDPSVDMNGQRPRTPSSGDHAPSPKRPRMDVATGFNPQMMQNGRPPPGMPPQMMGEATSQTNAMLLSGGVNPGNLSESQYASFQQQNPTVQQKSIQVFAQNMSKSSREGMSQAAPWWIEGSHFHADAMNMAALGTNPEYFPNGARPMTGHMGPNAGGNGGNGPNGNHALQDYQMQLMLLEQQNKKRLLMARQEQEGPQPGMPTYAPGMSPSGSRGGPSPGPGERRDTPKIGQGGSPLPEGSLRGSPAAMNAFNPMPPEMYPQMNGGMRPPPNGNSAFPGQFSTQQMEQLRPVNPQQGRMPNGNWQQGPQGPQGPQGQPSMNQQQASQPQPAQVGTPQSRNNEMPPPQGPPPGTVNGRPGADDAPPTPQTNPKPNPKKKNAEKKVRAMQSLTLLNRILNGEQKPTKKNSTSVAPTPTSEAENAAEPTPATPVTPAHRDSFASKAEGLQSNPAPVANDTGLQMAAPPADLNPAAQFTATGDGSDVGLFSFKRKFA